MQTFLPYSDFRKTAETLDYRRLGKQRVEAKQILDTLENGGGWSSHPAVQMWRAKEFWLAVYYNIIVDEWISRGYKNNMQFAKPLDYAVVPVPWWLGNEGFHARHRAILKGKMPDHPAYASFPEPALVKTGKNLPYLWPSPEKGVWIDNG